MKKPVLKAYYGDTFFEFVLQDRIADAVIILPAFPGKNDYLELITLFYDRGYHVFAPRYRGTYQSNGKFLAKNPVDDLVVFLEHLESSSVKSLWDLEEISFRINKKLLVGSGFNAPFACGLAARTRAFSHIVLISPVWDYTIHNNTGDEEDLIKLGLFVQRAYKNCYRFTFKNLLKRLRTFSALSPSEYIPLIAETPLLVFHDPNDKRVSFHHTKNMQLQLPRMTLIEHYLGHGLNEELFRAYWAEFDKFVKINYLG